MGVVEMQHPPWICDFHIYSLVSLLTIPHLWRWVANQLIRLFVRHLLFKESQYYLTTYVQLLYFIHSIYKLKRLITDHHEFVSFCFPLCLDFVYSFYILQIKPKGLIYGRSLARVIALSLLRF